MPSSSPLKAALKYARQGWHVFPVNGKVPTTPNGLKDGSASPKQVKELFRAYPGNGVGIVTGEPSGIVVLDIDDKDNVQELVARLEKEYGPEFKNTYTVRTGGGGYHFFFKHPGDRVGNRVGYLGRGVDLRGDGGYVVAPPSLHASGRRYKVIKETTIKVVPKWIVATDDAKKASTASPSRQGNADVLVPEGGRDNYLFKMGALLRRKGASDQAIEAALMEENAQRCDPPLLDTEVARIAASCGRYVPSATSGAVVLTDDTYVRAGDLYGDMKDFLNDEERVKGMPTGLEWLDKALGGGRRLGELTAWHAVAKAGKSSFLHYLMALLLEKGIPVGYASREMDPAEEVMPNILSIVKQRNVWHKKTKKGDKETIEKWPLYFAKGYGYFSAKDFQQWALSLKEKEGVQFFFLDHLLYALEDPEDYKEASRFCRDVKAFVREHSICLDMVVQPRYLQQGERLSMSSMRGGSAISQAIDNLFIMERVQDHPNHTQLRLEIGRSKLAEVGSEGFFKYDRDTTSFEEVEPVFAERSLEEVPDLKWGNKK